MKERTGLAKEFVREQQKIALVICLWLAPCKPRVLTSGLASGIYARTGFDVSTGARQPP